MKLKFLLSLLTLVCVSAVARDTYNFNSGWLVNIGDVDAGNKDVPLREGGSMPGLDDSGWRKVTLPWAHNEDEAFKVSIEQLTDTVAWYRKHFRVPKDKDDKVFVEFEGVRQGADFYINGHWLGRHENGVMAVGWDLTPYLKKGDNVIAVRTDNDWDYQESSTGSHYQWNDRNFNANYGGIPKNVYLHVSKPVYQTLPLWSGLGTTGTYIYATDIDVPGKSAMINVETQVRNDSKRPVELACRVTVTNPDGKQVASFTGSPVVIEPGKTDILSAKAPVKDLEFWSWGYGYLYDVETALVDLKGNVTDDVTTRTGFRKTRFADGKIWLNDRVIQMHGYAQRTSNEWPAVGIDIPAWLSDYSNSQIVESGGNLVRWMHVTPSKQDVMSCDRVGLIQAMPAADAEKDVDGRRWEHRVDLMRDAIIYNRNNPSILFYESGNKGISPEHMAQMKAIRDEFDPHGGRAIGSREMLGDNHCAEYGGEMLYINRSGRHPMWAMEYCRDEGLRKYWDPYSWPYHPEGEGPLYRDKDASEYNRNQDQFAVEMIRRWYDYWLERPGSGDRCSSGGVKIIFSDTNTHYRGKENYRRSGVTDAMRIPKDAFYAHKVMWTGAWVDNDSMLTHIIGHWNYPDSTVKPVYVVSGAPIVELLLNGRSLGEGRREYGFLNTFDSICWEPGVLLAVSKDENGKELSRHRLETTGKPVALRMTAMENPTGFRADGADVALIEIEVVDAEGRRCPLDNSMIHFELEGPAEWRGGIAQGPDNYILSRNLPVECGVNRVLVRSTTEPGDITLTANADGLKPAQVRMTTLPVEVKDGLNVDIPAISLHGNLKLGPTPSGDSYVDRLRTVKVASIKAGSKENDARLTIDDNEETQWASGGDISRAWISYELEREAEVSDICMKLTGWRNRSYPVEIFADETLVWSGDTPKGLGYVHLRPEQPVKARTMTVRLKGAAKDGDAFSLTELAGGAANKLEKSGGSKGQLRIVEIEFLENVN